MMGSESLIVDTATRIFRDFCDPQTVNRAADDAWKAPAWAALEEAGLTLAWVPETQGGAGADLADGFAVLRETGRFAVALPLAETLLAGWLLARAGIASAKGAMTCGPTRDGERLTLAGNGTLSGALRAVPFAKGAKHLAVLARREAGGSAVALIEAAQARVGEGTSIGGDPLNTLSFNGARPSSVKDAPADLDEQAMLLMGAAARAMQMAGALEAILDLSVAYANERIAFERAIAKFQAVQHNLARLAGEVAVAIAAAGSAADAIANTPAFDEAVFLEAASAKIRVGEAATEGAAIAHQVLGAIGFTKEHTLHRFTRRLWAWRDDFGNESFWAVKLGHLVAAKGADELWPMLAER
ncbi:MAG: acyl-CoA dehydrogenase [Alphaproteobacteria bacterium]|nr:MAG: acyl-CoA dehydrogenase [Alphaproteobacteria bacterium]